MSDSIDSNSKICFELLVNQANHNDRKYSDALIRRSKIEWNSVCKKCESLIDNEELNNFKIEKQTDLNTFQKIYRVNSTTVDSMLVKSLDTILYDDQLFRNSINPNNFKFEWQEQNKLDSLNCFKVEKILLKHGYPNRKTIGLKHSSTICVNRQIKVDH